MKGVPKILLFVMVRHSSALSHGLVDDGACCEQVVERNAVPPLAVTVRSSQLGNVGRQYWVAGMVVRERP
jgi:hypothetical protein